MQIGLRQNITACTKKKKKKLSKLSEYLFIFRGNRTVPCTQPINH